jgi:hypothetical protein
MKGKRAKRQSLIKENLFDKFNYSGYSWWSVQIDRRWLVYGRG